MKIGIIGAGKVGIAIAAVLRAKGFSISALASRRTESLDRAREYAGEGILYTLDTRQVVAGSDVIGITTQDREIAPLAQEIFTQFSDLSGKTFFHTSGAHTRGELKPLDQKGAALGSLHPLQTFPDIASGIQRLPSTYIFVEGDDRALPRLEGIAGALGCRTVRIASEHKVLYHLAAVFVCNLLCALLYEAEQIMQKTGIDLAPFYPIIHATLSNIESKGPLPSLTGPVVRGDAGTIESHLAAMEAMPPVAAVYRDLSLVALDMAEKRKALSLEQSETLRRLLSLPFCAKGETD